MNTASKKHSTKSHNEHLDAPDVSRMFESVLGCKWSLHVLGQIRRGVCRPGELSRSAPGLTEKVLNERLNKLLRFGVLEREVYAEAPPRVEYTLSAFGHRFVGILDEIEQLRNELTTGAE